MSSLISTPFNPSSKRFVLVSFLCLNFLDILFTSVLYHSFGFIELNIFSSMVGIHRFFFLKWIICCYIVYCFILFHASDRAYFLLSVITLGIALIDLFSVTALTVYLL